SPWQEAQLQAMSLPLCTSTGAVSSGLAADGVGRVRGATGSLAGVLAEPGSAQGARSLRYIPTPAMASANKTASRKMGIGRGGSQGSKLGSMSSIFGMLESVLSFMALLPRIAVC